MRVLGIDPSTKCGIAVVDDSGILFTEEIEFKKLTGLPRASAIVGRIMEIKAKWMPDKVMIEDMFVGHASSAITIIQIGTIIRYFLWQDDFPYEDVPPTFLKKWACGTGAGKKEQIMMAVYKKWGFESATNNIADAVVLAKMGVAGVSVVRAVKPGKVAKLGKV